MFYESCASPSSGSGAGMLGSFCQRIKRMVVNAGANDDVAEAFRRAAEGIKSESKALRRSLIASPNDDILSDLLANMRERGGNGDPGRTPPVG